MDKKKQIEEKVKQILAVKLGVKKENIQNNSMLVDDLGMDSFNAVELIYELENNFNIDVSDSDFQHIKTVEDINKHIRNRIKQ